MLSPGQLVYGLVQSGPVFCSQLLVKASGIFQNPFSFLGPNDAGGYKRLLITPFEGKLGQGYVVICFGNLIHNLQKIHDPGKHRLFKMLVKTVAAVCCREGLQFPVSAGKNTTA